MNLSQLRMAPTLPPPPPKFSGSALMRSPLTLMPCSAFSVFSSGASAVTLTISVGRADLEHRVHARGLRDLHADAVETNVLKPGASIVSS